MQSAEIILNSVSPDGHRLTTVKCRYPKAIHGEVMTHRVFSRNASSSRAIPTKKYLEEVRSDQLRYTPTFSVVNAPGMQGGRPTTEIERTELERLWGRAAGKAADLAENMADFGAAKQDVNRLLEPFIHINVLITATEWENFFALRCHPAAQPEMRDLAEKIRRAMMGNSPLALRPGDWHLPYIDQNVPFYVRDIDFPGLTELELKRRISVARCARVSYESFETGRRSTVEEDLALYGRLLESKHLSPFEHQATPDLRRQYGEWANIPEHGNFSGWRQLRKMIPGEACAPPAEE